MTVNELIAHLQALPVEQRTLEVHLWLPGTQFTIDGVVGRQPPGALNRLPVILLEGGAVAGSVLHPDNDMEFFR